MEALDRDQNDAVLPELLTEFMVDMKCVDCADSIRTKLQAVDGVENVEVQISEQVVRVLGTSPIKSLIEALDQTGLRARLIGQGVPDEYLASAAVAEFKGPAIFGVVRIAQLNMESTRIEANFTGLPSGTRHAWSINEFGDLTQGAATTGKVFNPNNTGVGELGTINVNDKGEGFYLGVKRGIKVMEVIGRSIVVYGSEDRSDGGIAAAVIARSAGVGDNYKKLCSCEGTTIWEASDLQNA